MATAKDQSKPVQKIAKRNNSCTDICVVCSQHRGKDRQDRQPTKICFEDHAPLLQFLQLPLEYLNAKEIKCHRGYCLYKSVLQKNLMRGDCWREDIQSLVRDFEATKKGPSAPILPLEEILSSAASFKEGLLKLKSLDFSSPVQFTLFPSQTVSGFEPSKKDEYMELCRKMLYGLLKLYESNKFFKKQGKLRIQNTSLDGGGFVFQHLQIAQKPPSTRT